MLESLVWATEHASDRPLPNICANRRAKRGRDELLRAATRLRMGLSSLLLAIMSCAFTCSWRRVSWSDFVRCAWCAFGPPQTMPSSFVMYFLPVVERLLSPEQAPRSCMATHV